jgi:Protein of unknown function (DUF3043)
MFRHRNAGATDGKAAQDSPVNNRPPAETGKGRPTPKRSEAERNRYTPISGVRSRAGSGKSGSAGSRTERARRYDAMKRGEDWALNVRDRGPLKKLARDYVDSKRRVSEYYLYAMIVMLVALLSRNSTLSLFIFPLLLVLIVAVAVDGFFIRRGLRGLAAERFPSEPTSGLTWYALMRSMQIRRMRVPKPQVSPGDKI